MCVVINGVIITMMSFYRERNSRARGEDGERQAQEGPQAAHHLLQLPAGRAAAALPEHAVPGAARESRAGRVPGAHTDTGTDTSSAYYVFIFIYTLFL